MIALLMGLVCTAPLPQSDLHKSLSNVATIESKPIDKPTSYIIHILDWHYIPKEMFLADLRDQGITDDLDAKYAKHLAAVENVQAEQMVLLRTLVEKHSVTEVYAEGVTKDNTPEYERRLEKLAKLGEKLCLLQKIAGEIDDANLRQKVKAGEQSLSIELLQVGVAAQLRMEGVLKTLPAEDENAFQAARPLRPDGKLKLDAKLNNAREDAIVKNVLTGGPVSVLILGGAHDLSDNVPDGCQYIRVGTKAYSAMLTKPCASGPQRRLQIPLIGESKERASLRLSDTQVFVGEIEILLPIVFSHVVLACSDVISDTALGRDIHSRPLFDG